MKITFILVSLFALVLRVAHAIPPACLLSAVNTQSDPADMSAVCGSNASKVQSAIASLCDTNNFSAAQSAFIATCSSAGVKVASYTGTASGMPATITGGTTATRSGSSAGATSSAGAAQPKMGGYAAAAIALVGAVAAL